MIRSHQSANVGDPGSIPSVSTRNSFRIHLLRWDSGVMIEIELCRLQAVEIVELRLRRVRLVRPPILRRRQPDVRLR